MSADIENKHTAHILIIDDSPEDMEIYRRYLNKDERTHYRIVRASTGEEGILAIDRESFDCILLDYHLPDMDGLDILDQIKKGDHKIPVIFLTGQGNETIAVNALKCGAAEYLVKGQLTPDLLNRSIRYTIDHFKQQMSMNEHLSFLEVLLDTIPNPIFFKSIDGLYRGCNAAFEKFIGLDRKNIIGKATRDIVAPDLARQCHAMDASLSDRPANQKFETTLSLPDGSVRHMLINRAPYFNIHGDLDGLVGVMLDITEQKLAEKQARHMAMHDELTKLANRHLFFDRLAHALFGAKRNQSMVVLLYIDLDGFKPVNDNMGHHAGDAVLIKIAQRIQGCIRGSDTAARIGGDEFSVILPEVTDDKFVDMICSRIHRAIEKPLDILKEQIHISASIGTSFYPSDADNAEDLIKKADAAMYHIKKSKKDNLFQIKRHKA